MDMDMDMDMDMNGGCGGGDSDDGGDGEGVWSPDIEQCFREALLLFPPCGRRKHILQEEGGGKMYGRNELIARHIKMRTGKTRTRKQVSSHIQVLARRKAKAEGGGSTSSIGMPSPPQPMGLHQGSDSAVSSNDGQQQLQNRTYSLDVWRDRPIVTQRIRLVEFSAFIERPSNYHHDLTPTTHSNPNSINSGAGMVNKDDGQQQVKQEDMSQIQAGMQRIGVSQQPHHVHQQQQQISTSHHPHSSPYIMASNITPPAATTPTNPATIHPLGSNHQLTAQFNQANNNYMTTTTTTTTTNNNNFIKNELGNGNNNSHSSSDGHQQSVHHNQITNHHHHHQSASQSTMGFIRHSYISMDFSSLSASASGCMLPNTNHNNNRLVESININQIFDKFPELAGSEGLFQRGKADSFFLVKFWADIHSDFEHEVGDQNSFFGYSCHFETCEPFRDITCSTKICSYGNPLVEKVEKIEGVLNPANGRQSFKISRSPMCDFMIEFIRKLRRVPSLSLMNSVLENFTALQLITSESTTEILLCLAYVFEILPPPASRSHGESPNNLQYNVYKLTKD